MAMKLPALTRISFVVPLLVGCALDRAGGTTTPAAHRSRRPRQSSTFPAPVHIGHARRQRPRPVRKQAVPPSERRRSATRLPCLGKHGGRGLVGSYCWVDRCVDMAGIPPKSRLPNDHDRHRSARVLACPTARRSPSWTISYGNYSNGEMTILDQGGASSDPDAQPASTPPELNSVEFDGPPNGRLGGDGACCPASRRRPLSRGT